ncbi:hypothetical protein [Nostoc sp. ChiQUE01b]|uniref:hypothetical protein n=1 Tax=Nostoc sp. ChiQUE01b TaxID=3075376 RepID=UPI002AD4CD7E|nr:hypothetical protein [Nostoc sp. ChiQUE01b]MDZ8263189.1 hypothetical protein [Nostoc sp. ChiQUE01b]
MANDKTLFEQGIAFLQNNPVVAGIMLIAVVVTGLATFTNAIRDLGKILSRLVISFTVVVGSEDKPTRLSSEQIRKLLVGKVEYGKLIEPTIPEMEGNLGTWYDAYYYSDGTMLYRRTASEFNTEKWVWSLDDRGSLCRGTSNEQMVCRSIESIGENWYQAVGFRTGTVRCRFQLKSGKPNDLV